MRGLKVIQPLKHIVFLDHVTNQKYFIFTSTIPEATKFSGMVTYGEELPTIKLHDHFKTWLCEVT